MFDSGTVWRDGDSALLWIDLADEVTLSYDLGDGGWLTLVGRRVFAVGSDARFVVAKQHPSGDHTVTNYFVLDKRRTDVRSLESATIGPLTESEYRAKAIELALPPFTRVLESLE